MAARGNVVEHNHIKMLGVVIDYDHENAAEGGLMNNLVRFFGPDGRPWGLGWYMDNEITVVDDGSY